MMNEQKAWSNFQLVITTEQHSAAENTFMIYILKEKLLSTQVSGNINSKSIKCFSFLFLTKSSKIFTYNEVLQLVKYTLI